MMDRKDTEVTSFYKNSQSNWRDGNILIQRFSNRLQLPENTRSETVTLVQSPCSVLCVHMNIFNYH